MTTLAQVVAQHGGAFASVVHGAITSWCKTATADEIKAAFFPERAGVEITVPQQEPVEEPPLCSYGEVYVIKIGGCEPYTMLMSQTAGIGEVPFLFHDKETARKVAQAHSIPFGNIVPVDLWKLDR